MHWYATQLMIAERQHELDRSEAQRRYRTPVGSRRGILPWRAHGRR
jgi:hypothetical protein